MIILLFIFAIVFLILGGSLVINDNLDINYGGICFIFLGLILIIIFKVSLEIQSYRQGQIDSLTGKVKYELKIQSDSTKTWEYKK